MFGNGKMLDIDRNKFQEAVEQTEWPKREVLKYAPPAIREQVREPEPLTAVQELAVLCRTLTYGEMIEFAEGVGADPGRIDAWARG
jgi:hypothetical protein